MIAFTNLTSKPIRRAIFVKLYKKVFSASGLELSVVFASSAFMRKLNKKYRKKDKVSNVLSFLLEKGNPNARKTRAGHQRGVGEIVLNRNEKNLPHLFVHGCLHLKRYDHKNDADAKKMEELEDKILNS